jgi:adenylate cyclase
VVPGADRDGTVQDALANSPLRLAYDEGRTVRCRLEGPPEQGEFGILADLRAAGLTDYYVMPIPFSDGSRKALTFATDRPGGFVDAEIATFDGIREAYAAVMEVRYLRHLAATLMNTYVGPVAGRRVLDGQIGRGAMETIRAAIWFCDLRGFTALSEIMPGRQIIDLLNDFFGAMAEAIAAGDGEILKFIGDAVLAIFVPADADDESEAAGRALDAASAFLAAVAKMNEARKAARRPELHCGVALHFGDVLYGNVGGSDRLDFTVIGPAVNLASRLQGMARELDRPLLVSAPFAALHGGRFDNLGDFELKGMGERRAIYAPAA